MRKAKHDIWFYDCKYKKDYRPININQSLDQEQQQVVKSFFRYLIVLKNERSVSQIMLAYRQSRMTNNF